MSIVGGELEQGAMSHVEIVDGKIRKDYIEPTTLYHKPYLFTSSDKLYLFERCSEHEAHEQLVQHLPNDYPKIYSYKEKGYEGEQLVTSTMEKLFKRDGIKMEDVKVCSVLMELLPYEQLDHIMLDKVRTIDDAINLMTLWFKRLLDIIRYAHLQPNDVHSGNMLAKINERTDKIEQIYVIDYAFYQRFQLVDIINSDSVNYGYKLDLKTRAVSKVNISTGETVILTPTCEFELSQYDAEMLLMDMLAFEIKRISVYRCFHLMIQILFGGEVVNIWVQAMKRLNCSQRFIETICSCLTNCRFEMSRMSTLRYWLDAPRSDTCQIRKLLNLSLSNKQEYSKICDKFEPDKDKIKKMNKQELFAYIKENKLNTMEERYVHVLCLGLSMSHEWLEMISYITRNEQKINKHLFAIEKVDGEVKVGDVIEWKNIVSASTTKEYALSLDETKGDGYLIEFVNATAAHMHHFSDDYTTHQMACNSGDTMDENYFNHDAVYKIVISEEYLLHSRNRYKVIEINKVNDYICLTVEQMN